MNTAQVIIMWYGGLGVFAILLFSALSEDSASSLIAAIDSPDRARYRYGWVGDEGTQGMGAVWVVIRVLLTVTAGYYSVTHH